MYRSNHWAFEGSDLYYGDVFGEEVPIVGYESDGLDYTFRYGSCVVVSMKKGKGEVFCAGTAEWPYALKSGEWFSEKITHNVLKRFTA